MAIEGSCMDVWPHNFCVIRTQNIIVQWHDRARLCNHASQGSERKDRVLNTVPMHNHKLDYKVTISIMKNLLMSG